MDTKMPKINKDNVRKHAALRQKIKQKNKVTVENKIIRPTLTQAHQTFEQSVKGISFFCPKSKNKGVEGQFLEKKLGIPTSSACLDCADGEVKVFPLRKLKNGEWRSKETVAITMSGLNHDKQRPFSKLQNIKTWDNSPLKKKTNNLLFISYTRDEDHITFVHSYLFNSMCPEYLQFESDYNKIINQYNTVGICQLEKNEDGYRTNTINGKYIQGRTKGQGGPNKTVGFYFRQTQFMKDVILYPTK